MLGRGDSPQAIRGYQAFLEFSEQVLKGEASEGMTVYLLFPRKKDFYSEQDWSDEYINIYSNSMSQIARLIESGRLPEHTKIVLYISNHDNRGFKSISAALKSGKCPAHFQLEIRFDTGCALEQDARGRLRMNHFAYESFSQHWVPQLAEALESGQCPAGLEIKLNYPLARRLKNRLDTATKTYHRLLEQQQAVVMAQGHQQANSLISILPEEVLNLCCYFMFDPQTRVAWSLSQCKDKLTEISASCFIENYWSFIPSELSTLFNKALQQILSSDCSSRVKASKIRCSAKLFLENSLGDLVDNEYRKSTAIAFAKRYHLIQSEKVVENPACAGEFRLAPALGIWKKPAVSQEAGIQPQSDQQAHSISRDKSHIVSKMN